MAFNSKRNTAAISGENSLTIQASLIAFGLAAPFATYAIAVSTLHQDTKVALLVGMSVIYLAICVWTFAQMRQAQKAGGAARATDQNPINELDQKLLALDDAREFFGSSLKPADMFRLVANRVNEIVPIAACMLLTKDAETGMLKVAQAHGTRATHLEGRSISADDSLAGLAFLGGEMETSGDIESAAKHFGAESFDGFESTAVLPLSHEGDTFAVFQIFFAGSEALTEDTRDKLFAINARISPLFLGSMAFERSLSNALTDPLTQLPNERAFHMVLENQLAESHRFRDDRPLTVMAIDIKNFDEMNREYGHAAGDRALSFAAEKIASQLRKMDFLARSMNDEFLIVLPKASERTAVEITGRIQSCLAMAPMKVNEEDEVKLWLNFGFATFWKDGESSQDLIQEALTKKQMAKLEDPSKVLMFPKEYVN
ncbi:MAG: sensor domain-containing diguanylate cyclase [bacterium]|nr:sensor domain-containing diguanylate cyclase [bacterium]